MNQADLTERFDALQDSLMELYESGETTLSAQIKHWQLIRKQYVYMYYSRKEGYKSLGLQPLPTLAVSEYKAKEAIHQILLLESLQNSEFGTEDWTLTETSAELTLTAPRDTFKKQPFIVDVWFDHDSNNSFPYTNWDRIYYQDEKDLWHVAAGDVDDNGLYFTDYKGEKNYFQLFAPDVERYSTTGEYTIKYKNKTISSVNSSQRANSTSLQGDVSSSKDSVSSTQTSTRRNKGQEGGPSSTTTSPILRRRRRRREQGESPERGEPKRLRREAAVGVPAGEVGRGSVSVPRRGLTRTQRLEAEARDPPIVLVKGGANNLKCWRNRHKHNNFCTRISTVFRWAGENDGNRMILAFKDLQQRELFFRYVSLPKHCTYSFGNLDSL